MTIVSTFQPAPRPRRILPALVGLALAWFGAATHAADLDWRTWQRIPVFSEGRIMPLDSFARDAAETICGRTSPRLSLDGATAAGKAEGAELTGARQLFPDGQPRRFSAGELLLSWMVEPEKWERVPFLTAEHEELRVKLLELPMLGADGSRLKYVSPWQVEHAPKFAARLRELSNKQEESERMGQRLEPVGVDKKVKDLYDAYAYFRLLTFDPRSPVQDQNRTYSLLLKAARAWSEIEPGLQQLRATASPGEKTNPVDAVSKAMESLLKVVRREDFTAKDLEPTLAELRSSTTSLAAQYDQLVKRLFQSAPDWNEDQLRRSRAAMQELATKVTALARDVSDVQVALYDPGRTMRLAPALVPAALESNRKTGDEAQPWASATLLLNGSDLALAGYPKPAVTKVREAMAAVKAAYIDRQAADRPVRFAQATADLSNALRTLGNELEPIRRNLPIENRDDELLAVTAYPPVGAGNAELHYNHFDPFFWSWLANFLALVALAVSFGVLRRPMFWSGLVLLTVGQALSAYAFGLRTYITGWAPVTGMFETVVFVAFVAALLALWFTLLPLVWPGMLRAWRMTALPMSWEATPLSAAERNFFAPETWNKLNWAMLLPRLAVGAALFAVLAIVPYRTEGHLAIISLLPRADVGSRMPSMMDIITWLVGLSVLLPTVWYTPRLAMATVASLLTIPRSLRLEGMERPLAQVTHRKAFVLAGAGIAFLVAYIAYYSPLWPKEIGSLMPVLRDRFWLYIHVLTITASYGAGALAFGLGMISLAYYLFGKYRAPHEQLDSALLAEHRPAGNVQPRHSLGMRPPEETNALGTFIYKTTQVAVVLLAAGTILGGLWADVAWGRFWGWDAKEVWALISLLVYLTILHGRYAGWLGNFGLAAGSVIGASSIVMAWYGVNYYLRSGLHTYASGAGGQVYVFGFLTACWVYLAVALFRYLGQTKPVEEVVERSATTQDQSAWGAAKPSKV